MGRAARSRQGGKVVSLKSERKTYAVTACDSNERLSISEWILQCLRSRILKFSSERMAAAEAFSANAGARARMDAAVESIEMRAHYMKRE